MDEPHAVARDLWDTFVAKHAVGVDTQDAFLDYVMQEEALPIRTLAALEHAYRYFLRREYPPLDLQ